VLKMTSIALSCRGWNSWRLRKEESGKSNIIKTKNQVSIMVLNQKISER
jgi:hypothetical protein